MPIDSLKRAYPDSELLRVLVDKVSAMLAYWDADLRCRFANRAYQRWFGVSPESLIGKHISELLGPIYSLNLPYIEGALRGEEQEFEREIPDPSGGPPRHSLANYLPDIVDGVVRGFFVLVTDISKVHRTEHALRESEERFKLTIDEAPIGMALVATEGHFIRVNRALSEIVGYSAEELTGLTFQAITHPDDLAADLALVGQLLRGEIPRYQLAKRYIRKDGTVVDVMLSVSLLRDRDGKPLYFIAQIEDITERKRLEEQLRLAEAKSSGILAISADAIISIDDYQRITMFNEGAERIFGYSRTEVLGASLDMLIPERVRAAHRQFVEKFAAGQESARRMGKRDIAILGRRKSGEEFPADAAISKLEVGGKRILTVALRDITEQKRAQDELHQSQERLELALEGADLASRDWNVMTGEVIFNPRWSEMRGFRPEEIRLHVDSWISGIHPDDRVRVQKVLMDYFHGHLSKYETEHRVLTKSGSWIWILDRGKVFARDQAGHPTRMVGTELDITDRKRLEEELRFSEAKFSGIVSISADAIVSIDEDQSITLFNEGAEKIFGYSKAEVLGAPFDMLIPKRLRSIHRQHVEKFAAGNQIARRMGEGGAPILGLRKNGEEFPIDAAISKLDVNGKRILTVALRDVTTQKRIEKEQRFLAGVGPVLATTLDYEGTLTRAAELAVQDLADICIVDIVEDDEEVRRLKVASRDPTQAWLGELFTNIPRDRSRPHLLRSVWETRQPLLLTCPSNELTAVLAQGDDPHLARLAAEIRALVAVPLIAHGQLLGVIAFISVTDSRVYGAADVRLAEELAQRAALSIYKARLYRAAQRATQARDEVLSIVAHDLRNPLNSILLNVRLLKVCKAEPGRNAEELAMAIERAATRMNRLIRDLLDVTRLDAGRLCLESATVVPRQLISDCLDALRPLAKDASLELRSEVAADLPEIFADRDRLLQVFENLIGNALKFTLPGGCITVGAAQKDKDLLCWVRDTGSGIAAEDLPHLFDRFWQSKHAVKRGAGLGLSIVKGIVAAHRGRVWVESTEGKGSTFFFTIPTANRTDPNS